MRAETRVGFIGLGDQGGPMARRIIDAGYPTTLWARRATSLEPFTDTAAHLAGSPAELAAASDLVCLCVVSDADVEQVLTSEDGVLAGLPKDGIVVVHSTVHPHTCRRLADEHGISMVDAPVSGGGGAAAEGRLLVMAGGEADSVARCRPVFESYAEHVVHLGPLGCGQLAKLLNNLLFTANLATAADVVRLGRSLGTDADQLAEVLSYGSGGSFALGSVARGGGSLDALAAHAGHLLRKDVGLARSLATQAEVEEGIALVAAEAALSIMEGSQCTTT